MSNLISAHICICSDNDEPPSRSLFIPATFEDAAPWLHQSQSHMTSGAIMMRHHDYYASTISAKVANKCF